VVRTILPVGGFRLTRESPEIREGDPTLGQSVMFQQNTDVRTIAHPKVEKNQLSEN